MKKDTNLDQMEMLSLELLISTDHVYRKYCELLDFDWLTKSLLRLEKTLGSNGYGIACLFKCLLLQFMEDLSDRELQVSVS